MSAKLVCKAKDPETGVLTFEYTYGGNLPRVVEFKVPHVELEQWFKTITNLSQITNAPFETGPGLFDHPIMSFTLYSLVMMIGGDEELVGAEYSITAPKKAKLDADGIPL